MNSTEWRRQLGVDVIPSLLSSGNEAVVYFTNRDLLDKPVAPIESVWQLPESQKLLRKQQTDGSWPFTGKKTAVYPPEHHSLVETFKRFRLLVEKYQFNTGHTALANAAEYLFSFQTPEGDIRGFIGNQYATYYTGYVLSLLIMAGYADDPRTEKGMRWLLAMRQNDGGWTVPILTHSYDRQTGYDLTSKYMDPVEPDRSKPFSHNWTDMVLRAFAAHPRYRDSGEAKAAGALLKSQFFMPDAYTSYQAPSYWVRFGFWWPNLLTAMESLSLIGFPINDPDIKKGLDWFIVNQDVDGLWNVSYNKEKGFRNAKTIGEREWLSLRICRMLKRYFQ